MLQYINPTYLHTYLPTYLPYIHTYVRTYVRTYIHTYIHVGGKKIYMHISNDIDIDIYIYTHTVCIKYSIFIDIQKKLQNLWKIFCRYSEDTLKIVYFFRYSIYFAYIVHIYSIGIPLITHIDGQFTSQSCEALQGHSLPGEGPRQQGDRPGTGAIGAARMEPSGGGCVRTWCLIYCVYVNV